MIIETAFPDRDTNAGMSLACSRTKARPICLEFE